MVVVIGAGDVRSGSVLTAERSPASELAFMRTWDAILSEYSL